MTATPVFGTPAGGGYTARVGTLTLKTRPSSMRSGGASAMRPGTPSGKRSRIWLGLSRPGGVADAEARAGDAVLGATLSGLLAEGDGAGRPTLWQAVRSARVMTAAEVVRTVMARQSGRGSIS